MLGLWAEASLKIDFDDFPIQPPVKMGKPSLAPCKKKIVDMQCMLQHFAGKLALLSVELPVPVEGQLVSIGGQIWYQV